MQDIKTLLTIYIAIVLLIGLIHAVLFYKAIKKHLQSL